MSGHSKWSNIKNKKDKEDQKKGQVFTKISKAITLLARQGGSDVNMNFALRLAVDKARQANMPKDNIDRAIKRGTGESQDGEVVEEILYEGFGPGGVAFIVEAITDNRNRTVSELKYLFSKAGGSLGTPGSVQWQFERKGVIRISAEEKSKVSDWDGFQLSLMDFGLEDIKEFDEGVELSMEVNDFKNVLEEVEKKNLQIEDSGLEWIAKENLAVDTGTAQKVENLVEQLEENEDVRAVFTNLN